MKSQKHSLTQKALSFWGGILIAWSIYRSYFRLPIEADELLIKPIIFLGPVIYFIRKIEKKPIAKSLWLKKEKIIEDLLFSLLAAISLFLVYFSFKAIGLLNFTLNLGTLSFKFFLVNLATAISEETLSQGFVLKKLYEEKQNIFQSVFIASVLYFIIRIPVLFTQPTLTGVTLLYTMIVSFLLSFSLGLLFLYRKSLWAPIFLHFVYLAFVNIFLLK